MSKKSKFHLVALVVLVGFYPVVQVLGQTPVVTIRQLEFSRSGWETYTPRDYSPGVSLLEGDFEFVLNLTIHSYDKNVTISEKADIPHYSKLIEVGEVSENLYLDSPLYIYLPNRSASVQWWFYWLNSSSLDSTMHFDLLLEHGGTAFLDSLFYQEGNWLGNETLLTHSPLTMRVNPLADNWILSGSDTYNTTDNYLVNRSLSFKYDMDGYLLRLDGDMCIARGIYFYEYYFSWRRESKMTTDVPYESNTNESTISFLFMGTLIAIIALSQRVDRKFA